MVLFIIFVIVVSMIATLSAIKIIYDSRRHLGLEELGEVFYQRGELTADQYSRITRHLGTCRQCQRELENWVRSPETN